MHPSGCVSPRQGRKKWVWAHQKALFQKFGVFCRPWIRSIFCCKIFLDFSLPESHTMLPELHLDSFSSKTDHGAARYLRFCENIFGKCAKHIRHDLPRRCAIKYGCKTALRSSPSLLAIWFCSQGRMHPSGCVSPRQGRKNCVWAHSGALLR